MNLELTDQQNVRLSQIKRHDPMYLGIFDRAFRGKSKAVGIRAKCLDCCCWQRREVQLCTASACPLWPYRPYQNRKNRVTPAP